MEQEERQADAGERGRGDNQASFSREFLEEISMHMQNANMKNFVKDLKVTEIGKDDNQENS